MLTFPGRQKLTDPQIIALYEELPYLEAYAQHTSIRVQQHGPAAAIGGDWEAGGQRQLAFLQAHGLSRQSWLLDIGCGTGRFARQVVPYLEPANYAGTDVSRRALQAAEEVAQTEGWGRQMPLWLHTPDGTVTRLAGHTYEVIWCYAVLIHLPTTAIEALIASLQGIHFNTMYFSYKPSPQPVRTSYKQFSAPLSWYAETAQRYGFRVQVVTDGMPNIPQPMGMLTRA